MKRWPKYKTMPVALLIYFVAMAVFSIYHNNWQLPDRFLLIIVVELVVIIALYFLLKKRYNG